jgi:seryl-tRNA synthetase
MLDIKFIRENRDLVEMAARKKRMSVDVGRLIELDDKRLELQKSVEAKRARQNEVSREIPVADPERKAALLAEMGALKGEMKTEEDAHATVVAEWRELMLQVPNIPDISVPDGADDSANQELETWGEAPKFSFAPKSHTELCESLGLADFEAGTRVSGFRGYFLTGWGARLEHAIVSLAIDLLSAKGYRMMRVPSLVRRETLLGTGYLPQGEEDLYRTQDGEYLAGTGEVGAMSRFAGQTLDLGKLPAKFIAISPCFRREAGSHGKDTKGLIRVHEFWKLEQVILCEASHEESVRLHEELRANAEEILRALELPYRVVVNCGGDIGQGQVKKYDLEAWVPSEGKYRETHSASYFHDFQTRRLQIKYVDAAGERRLAHSLNNTAVASPRILVPLLECHQQADGSVRIPERLRPYLGGAESIRPE